MKYINSILWFNASILLLALSFSIGAYFISNNLYELEKKHDYEVVAINAEATNDIAWLKSGIKLMAEQRRNTQQEKIQWYKDLGHYHLIIILISLVSIFYCLKLRKLLVSNKSLNLTSQKDAPTS